MAAHSVSHQKLDQLRRQCDRLLDDALTYPAFARDMIQAVMEIEQLTAVAIIEVHTAQDLRVQAGIGLEQLAGDGFFNIDPDHVSLILAALRQQKPMLTTDRYVPEAGLKRHSVLIAPLPAKQAPIRVLELYTLQIPDSEQAAHLKEVAEVITGYSGRFLQEQSTKQTTHGSDEFWKQFDVFLLKLQKSLDLKQTVAVAVNDGRLLIGCDRVSIALKHGSQTKVHGISGQEGVQQRANLVKAMTRLAATVIKMGSPITYRGTVEDLPPQIEKPLADYLAESRTRMVKLIPLREPAPLESHDDQEQSPRRKASPRRLLGCLIVEQATETRPKPQVSERAELLTEHVEVAITNCERYESIFLLPLWRALGRGVRWFKGRRLWIAVAVASALAAVGLTLAFLPWEYRVEGTGHAMPVIQHEVFAPWDGDVQEILVDSGQRVKAGDPLIILESDELDAEAIAVANELEEKKKLVLTLTQQQYQAQEKNDGDKVLQIQGELLKAGIEADGAQIRLDKIRSRIEKLTIKSPADGVVATFQVKQLLQNRPVRRGELLVEVMEPEGPWRLELEVPEYRMGHVLSALKSSPDDTLPVEYVLATAVETSRKARMTEIATRSNQSQEQGTIVEIYADLDQSDLPDRNIGAEVTAKINCGKKSLFYVLFGDVVEFFQRYFWV